MIVERRVVEGLVPVVVGRRGAKLAPVRIGREEVARRKERPGLGDIVDDNIAARRDGAGAAGDIERGEFVVVVAVDEHQLRVNVMPFHIAEERHRILGVELDVTKQFRRPKLEHRGNILAAKWIDRVSDAFAVGVKRTADRLGGSRLIGADFEHVIGTKIADEAVQQGL